MCQGSEPFELDVILLEVGLGGRLDAVNCVDPDLAVITTIDIDHTEWLGDSIEAIAREKAGIMRRGQAVVFADAAAPDALYQQASALECSVIDRTQYGILGATDANNAHWSDQYWSWFGVSTRDQERVTCELQGLPVPNIPLISAATAIQLLYRLFEMKSIGRHRVVERDRSGFGVAPG